MAPITPPESVIAALEYLLRPLVLLCMRFGIDYRRLSDMLKGIFVSVAERDLAIPGKAQTDSRISLVTGVHRKDVRVLRGRVAKKVRLKPEQSVIANLISVWLGTPTLLYESGDPKPIPRLHSDDLPVSFDAIVSSLTNDIRPRAVFDECLRQGIVTIDHNGFVHLSAEALIPDKGLDEKAYFFSQNVYSHMAAAGHNLAGDMPPFLDRYVWHSDLSMDAAARIALAAEKAGMKALRSVNQFAVDEIDKEKNRGVTKDRRIHFGVYFYSEKTASASDATNPTE